jgi:hypothetical protein
MDFLFEFQVFILMDQSLIEYGFKKEIRVLEFDPALTDMKALQGRDSQRCC